MMRARKNKKDSLDRHWSDVKDKLDLGLELRRPFERQWVLNMAFVAGNQYSVFNATTHMLQTLPTTPGKVRIVDNIILPKWQRQISDLIKGRPRIAVVPNSIQEEDIMAARLGTKAAQWYYRDKLLKKKLRGLAVWIYTTGNAFLDDIWDKKAGPMGFDKEKGVYVYAGDVGGSVWSPFEIVVPATFGDVDHQALPWLAKVQRKHINWFKEGFKRGEEVVEERLSSSLITLESLMSSYMAPALGSTALGNVPSAYMVNMYIKPCKDYPKGAFIEAANGIVFNIQDYPFQEFSIEHFKDLELPGVFWGDSKTTHAIQLQKSWNVEISSIEEFNRKIAKAKLRVPKNSNLEFQPDSSHGELIEYKPVLGHKPEYMEIKGVGPSPDRNLERIQFSMENLYSQHEVSRGTNRSDIRSGDMVELLLEQDAHGTIPSHAVFEEGLEQHLRRVLMRMQQGYTAQRILKIGETEDEFEAVAFTGADLKGNKDVKVVKESSLPDSPAARNMLVERRYQMGLLGPPADPRVRRRVLRMLDSNVVDDVFSGEKQDEGLAKWENSNMLQGRPMLVNTYDDHIIHLDEHNRLRKSVRYHKAMITNPEAGFQIDMLIEKHNQMHTELINEAIMKQMAAGGQDGGQQKPVARN